MGRRYVMQFIVLALLLSAWCAVPVSAAALDELTPFLSASYFTWEEFNGGRRLLKESGPLYSGGVVLGFTVPSSTPSALAIRGKAELFGGVVDYNGETQAPNPVPVKTEVSYLGSKQELDLGYRYRADGWYLEGFNGLGYRWWLRGLRDGTSATGTAVSGYTESWDTAYYRAGARGRYRDPSGLSLYAEAGGKYPFYTGNSVDFVGFGRTTFRPEGRWSGFADAGLTYRHLNLALSYEGFKYAQSPVVQVGSQRFLQPDSSSDIFGLRLGWAFR